MKVKIFFLVLVITIVLNAQINYNTDDKTLEEIHNHVLTQDKSYEWLTHITKNIGARLTGSDAIDDMVTYTKQELEKLGLDSVWVERVMTPKWTRGEPEEAYIVSEGKKTKVEILALGGSIATPKSGIKAKVVEEIGRAHV